MPDLKHTLSTLFATIPALSSLQFELIKLAGQASYREYFRATFSDEKSVIIMKMPVGASSVAEEITKATKQIDELPFINIANYLKEIKLPVPQILGYFPKDGILVLQDLGDVSFEQKIIENPSQRLAFYKNAVELLVKFKTATNKNKDENCIAYHRKFEPELLEWELNHFVEYGIEDRLGQKVAPGDKKLFIAIFKEIAQSIDRMPQSLVHRDYQSRNIMFFENQLWLIDFQDALLGPEIYDLVALLRDSYIELPIAEIEQLQTYYHSLLPEDAPYKGTLAALRHDFWTVALQRKLKDSGRFQYIKTVKGNPDFMVHFPLSIKYVKESLDRLPQYARLWKLLLKYVPEYNTCPSFN